MELVTNNLENRLLRELKESKESVTIISPFISLSIIERLVNVLKKQI